MDSQGAIKATQVEGLGKKARPGKRCYHTRLRPRPTVCLVAIFCLETIATDQISCIIEAVIQQFLFLFRYSIPLFYVSDLQVLLFHCLRQFLFIQPLGVCPHTRLLSVRKFEQRRKKVSTKLLRCFPGE